MGFEIMIEHEQMKCNLVEFHFKFDRHNANRKCTALAKETYTGHQLTQIEEQVYIRRDCPEWAVGEQEECPGRCPGINILGTVRSILGVQNYQYTKPPH